MQKVSDIFLDNIKNLPIWVKQVMAKEILDDMNKKLADFNELTQSEILFQYMVPKLSFKGKQELQERTMRLSGAFYTFLQDLSEENNMFEITVKNSWSFADTAKIFVKCDELEFLSTSDKSLEKNIALAMFIAGKIKTGEFLKKIGRIDAIQLEQAIRYQKQLNDEGRHIKMASIMIKMGFISDKGLDSLLLLKDEAKRRLPVSLGITSIKCDSPEEEQNQVLRLQKEITRLESENLIMKKRLKKLLNIN